MSERITFAECVLRASEDASLVADFDRLRGTNVGLRGSPLEVAVDIGSGRLESEMALFLDFVRDCVWDRLPPGVRADGPAPDGGIGGRA